MRLGVKSRFIKKIPRDPWWVMSTGKTWALISIELHFKRSLQSTFFVPITTGFSFLLCRRTVKWIGWFSLSIKDESNLLVPWSPSNSKMNVSSKLTSHAALCYLVWNLFLRKLTATLTYSSSLGLTKSTSALPPTRLQQRYLLLGSSDLVPLKPVFFDPRPPIDPDADSSKFPLCPPLF